MSAARITLVTANCVMAAATSTDAIGVTLAELAESRGDLETAGRAWKRAAAE